MRRPGTIALLTTVLLLAVASPALHVQLAPDNAQVLPASSQPRQIANVCQTISPSTARRR